MITNEAFDEVIKYIKADMDAIQKQKEDLENRLSFLKNMSSYLASICCVNQPPQQDILNWKGSSDAWHK